jgi:uncharacterized protein YjiS (DUF1127 family)
MYCGAQCRLSSAMFGLMLPSSNLIHGKFQMSTYTQLSMTNHHELLAWSRAAGTVRLWWQRHQQRRELAQWTERDLHDLGLSWSEMIAEADKPFWRA